MEALSISFNPKSCIVGLLRGSSCFNFGQLMLYSAVYYYSSDIIHVKLDKSLLFFVLLLSLGKYSSLKQGRKLTLSCAPQIRKQIQAVNEVYKLHNLPEFYKDPRPHISVTWALGDIRDTLKRMVEEEMKKYILVSTSPQKCIFTSKFNGILCKIGNKTHEICKFQEE
nr:U6 snRNA phosphodiesterase-like [Nicotiana tomentosiformis]